MSGTHNTLSRGRARMSKAHAQRRAGPSSVGHFAPGLSLLLERQNTMRTATASKVDRNITTIGRQLARRGVDILLDVEVGNALVRCQVSSRDRRCHAGAARSRGLGQFRPLTHNMVEIDAAVTLATAQEMLTARAEALAGSVCLH
jgi:hypothetical protein